jgi:hypothetical protein
MSYTQKVKHGVYQRREGHHRKVTVTHADVYINFADGSMARGVIYHTFNEPELVTHVMPERDFLRRYKFVGNLFTIHRVEERVRTRGLQ